jgi:guanylate kinase
MRPPAGPRARGLLLVLSGPGGVGKTSLSMEWRRRDPSLRYTTSVTTRAPRAKAEDYEHVTADVFDALLAGDEFVQWINPPGLDHYGTRRAPIDACLADGMDMVFDYVPEGYLNLRRAYPDHVVGIFVMAPSLEIMRERLEQRGTEAAGEVDVRTEMAHQDFGYIDWHDYFVVNEDFEQTMAALEAIRCAEQLRPRRSAAAAGFADAGRPAPLRYYAPAPPSR